MHGHTSLDIGAALGRARMLLSMLAAPKLRRALGEQLAGGCPSDDPSVRGPLSRLDWLPGDGEIDVESVREMTAALSVMRSPAAILEVGRLESLPERAAERIAVSRRLVGLVLDRLGTGRAISEAELNAALAMVTKDVALVRRDAVDSGLLTRTADGAQYHLAPVPS